MGILWKRSIGRHRGLLFVLILDHLEGQESQTIWKCGTIKLSSQNPIPFFWARKFLHEASICWLLVKGREVFFSLPPFSLPLPPFIRYFCAFMCPFLLGVANNIFLFACQKNNGCSGKLFKVLQHQRLHLRFWAKIMHNKHCRW